MPIRTVFETKIEHLSILNEQGEFDTKLGKDLIPDEDLVRLFEHLVTCRHFDEISFKLQRSGRMGTYPENRGQEATSLGAAYALKPADWLVPCYRENAGLFWRGLPTEYVLLHWMGDERGNQIPEGLNITPLAIPIGTQMLHATGLAWASKYRGEEGIACTFFGDGASSEGDFHEAANFAANLEYPRHLPVPEQRLGDLRRPRRSSAPPPRWPSAGSPTAWTASRWTATTSSPW